MDRIIAHESSAQEASQNKLIILRPDVVLKNYGSTPANTFMAEAQLKLLDFPTAENVQLQVTDRNGLCVVPPGKDFWMPSLSIMMSFDEWNQVCRSEKKLVLFGRAHYDDVFGRPHKSARLYWYETEKVGGFVPGPFHNYAT